MRSGWASRRGIAAISCDLSATATCPRTNRLALEQEVAPSGSRNPWGDEIMELGRDPRHRCLSHCMPRFLWGGHSRTRRDRIIRKPQPTARSQSRCDRPVRPARQLHRAVKELRKLPFSFEAASASMCFLGMHLPGESPVRSALRYSPASGSMKTSPWRSAAASMAGISNVPVGSGWPGAIGVPISRKKPSRSFPGTRTARQRQGVAPAT